MATNQTVSFVGRAHDVNTGSMAEELLTWWSSSQGPLGHGAKLAVSGLTPGLHTITFRADDDAGGIVSDTIELVVVSDPGQIPVPDALWVSPRPLRIFLQRSADAVWLTIENENPERDIGWGAIASEGWIQLDRESGTTSDRVGITYVGEDLATETRIGHVALTSPDVPGQNLRLIVEVVSESQVVLPLVLRSHT